MSQGGGKQAGEGGSDSIYVSLGFIIAIYYGGIYGYEYFRIPINTAILYIYKAELYLFQWIPNSDAKMLYEGFEWDKPQNHHADTMGTLGLLVGNYIRWPICIVIAVLATRSWIHHGVGDQFKRNFTFQSLLIESVKNFPCLAPVVGRDILNEPLDSGPWKVARTPLQYAIENELIVRADGKDLDKSLFISQKTGMVNLRSPVTVEHGHGYEFDSAAADVLFKKQIGDRLTSIKSLSDYKVGLIGAFMAFGAGNKDKGQGMLDQMSVSFVEGPGPVDLKIDVEGAMELFNQYSQDAGMLDATSKHRSFVNVFILALYKYAKQKGVISSSQFIWLRPTDRTLWYTLNQEGGREPWSEATMPFIHFRLEQMLGNTVEFIDTDIAISNYQDKLHKGGWIAEPSSRKK